MNFTTGSDYLKDYNFFPHESACFYDLDEKAFFCPIISKSMHDENVLNSHQFSSSQFSSCPIFFFFHPASTDTFDRAHFWHLNYPAAKVAFNLVNAINAF